MSRIITIIMQLHKGQTRTKPHGPALLQPDEPRTRSNPHNKCIHCAPARSRHHNAAKHKYRRCQPRLSASLLHFTFASESSDTITQHLQLLLIVTDNTKHLQSIADLISLVNTVFLIQYMKMWWKTVSSSPCNVHPRCLIKGCLFNGLVKVRNCYSKYNMILYQARNWCIRKLD